MGCSSEEIDHERKEENRRKVKKYSPRLAGMAPDEGVSLMGGFHEGAGAM